jgi:hypothetical protein
MLAAIVLGWVGPTPEHKQFFKAKLAPMEKVGAYVPKWAGAAAV